MGKITKQQLRLHEQAEQLLWGGDKPLRRDEIAFCLEHWDPRAAAGKHVARNQAYFTPMSLARDTAMYVGGDGRRVVDICAGIGRLAFAVLEANLWRPQEARVTAVELNPDYVRVGRRLLPQAEWICGDCFDRDLWRWLPRFDEAISNPPFGAVVANGDTGWIGYRGPAGLMLAAVGLQVARLGLRIILPQSQTIFRYSGRCCGRGAPHTAYTESYPRYLEKFLAGRPSLEWHHSSLDTTLPLYQSAWRGASPLVEVVTLCDRDGALLPLAHAPSPPSLPRPVCRLF
jgi:SAM-dependent methyltransferase